MRLNKIPSYTIKQQTGVSPRFQYNIEQSGARQPGKTPPGAPHEIDHDTIKKMRQSLKGNYNETRKRWNERVKDLGLDITPRTLKQAAYDVRPRMKKGKAV